MAAATKNVAFAESAVTVHVKMASEPSPLLDGTEVWDIESRNMRPGDTLPLSDMPPYLSDAIKGGKVPGLRLITAAQAKKVSTFVQEQKDALQALTEVEEQESDPDFPAEEF